MWLAGSGAAAMTVAVVVTVTVWYYLLLSPFLKQDDDEGGFFGLVCPFGSSVRMSVPSVFGVYDGGGGGGGDGGGRGSYIEFVMSYKVCHTIWQNENK